MDDVKKLCVSMRKNAKDEHALFHYNGHGVPRPTHNGEIWVFNKTFTQVNIGFWFNMIILVIVAEFADK